MARESTVVFNNIDYGATFDFAINSLCKSLGIPYVAASTYSNQTELGLYTGALDACCWYCCNGNGESFRFTDADYKHFLEQTRACASAGAAGAAGASAAAGSASSPSAQELKDFSFADEKEVCFDRETEKNKAQQNLTNKQSHKQTTTATSHTPPCERNPPQRQVLSFLNVTRKMSGSACEAMVKEALATAAAAPSSSSASASGASASSDSGSGSGSRPFPLARGEFDKVVARALKAQVNAALGPERVQTLADARFLPKDRPFPSRNVGSWTCVCVAGSVLLVNQWVQHVNCDRAQGKEVHNWSQLNLLAAENGGISATSCASGQDPACPVCTAAKAAARARAKALVDGLKP